MKMTKAAAIRATANAVAIYSHGEIWYISGPVNPFYPMVPSFESVAGSHQRARIVAMQRRVEAVLVLMGKWTHDVFNAIYDASDDHDGVRDMRALVDLGLKEFDRLSG